MTDKKKKIIILSIVVIWALAIAAIVILNVSSGRSTEESAKETVSQTEASQTVSESVTEAAEEQTAKQSGSGTSTGGTAVIDSVLEDMSLSSLGTYTYTYNESAKELDVVLTLTSDMEIVISGAKQGDENSKVVWEAFSQGLIEMQKQTETSLEENNVNAVVTLTVKDPSGATVLVSKGGKAVETI